MSAPGPNRTCAGAPHMSAFGGKADFRGGVLWPLRWVMSSRFLAAGAKINPFQCVEYYKDARAQRAGMRWPIQPRLNGPMRLGTPSQAAQRSRPVATIVT